MPKSMAIAMGLFIVIILFAALLFILVLQVDAFLLDLPQLHAKLEPLLQKWQRWVSDNFNITVTYQNEWFENSLKQIGSNIGGLLQVL